MEVELLTTKENELTVHGKNMVIIDLLKSFLINENANFKSWDIGSGEFDIRFKYGLNAFGLRIKLLIQEVGIDIFSITFIGDFIDATDTSGDAEKKAKELVLKFATYLTEITRQSSRSVLTNSVQDDTHRFGKLLNVGFFKWFVIFAIAVGVSSFVSAGLALFAGLAGAFGSLLFAKSLAKKAHGVKVIDGNDPEYAGLYEMVQELSIKAGIPVPEVGVYQSDDMNAFATGVSQRNSLVAFSTALLEKMEMREVQAVAAHEIGHIVSRDMIAMSLFQGTISAVILFFTFPLQILRVINVFTNNNGTTFAIDAILWFIKFIAMLVLTFFGSIVLNAFSRKREYRADAIASILVGKEAMLSALTTLSTDTVSVPKSQMGYNSMKISAPQVFLEWFSTHPAIEKRSKALEFEIYSRLVNEKKIYSRTTASILGILLCFVGAHHFYMRRPLWSLPNLLMSIFSLPIVLAEIYVYWTRSKSDEEFEEKFVQQDGAKKVRLIALALMIPVALVYVTWGKKYTNTGHDVNNVSITSQAIQNPASNMVEKPTEGVSQALPFIGEKIFNFYGGSTGMKVTIESSGHIEVKPFGTPDTYNNFKAIDAARYSGEFSNPLILDDKSGLLFKNEKVFLLNEDGAIATDCVRFDVESTECVSDLNKQK